LTALIIGGLGALALILTGDPEGGKTILLMLISYGFGVFKSHKEAKKK